VYFFEEGLNMIELMNLRSHPIHQDNAVRIDRKSKWGNPYKMETESDRLKVIKKYVYYILTNDKLLDSLPELEEKWLYCWCYPKPCHGSVLKYLCEHPEVIGMYRGKTISMDDIVRMIFEENGWKCESKTQQLTLF
jgi:hypothetical protein